MREQFARLIDDGRVPVKRSVSLAGRFRRSIVFRRHIRDGDPLRLAVYAVERLITRIRQCQKTIRALLDGRFRCRKGDRGEREQEGEEEGKTIVTTHGAEVSRNQPCRASAPPTGDDQITLRGIQHRVPTPVPL